MNNSLPAIEKNENPRVEYEVAYCGRYCRPCHSHKDAMREAAAQLLALLTTHMGVTKSIDRQGGDHKAVIKGLEILSKYACKLNCKGGGGFRSCAIRKCCRSKNLRFCFECTEFPCQQNWGKWKSFSDQEIQRLQEMKEKGVETWIQEQWG